MKIVLSHEKVESVESNIALAYERAAALRKRFEEEKAKLSKGDVALVASFEDIEQITTALQDALTDVRLLRQERRSLSETGQKAAESIKSQLNNMPLPSAYAYACKNYAPDQLLFYNDIVAANIKAMLYDYFGSKSLPTDTWK